jgi:hypothetical protein
MMSVRQSVERVTEETEIRCPPQIPQGSNLGRRGGKPATNRLTLDKVIKLSNVPYFPGSLYNYRSGFFWVVISRSTAVSEGDYASAL